MTQYNLLENSPGLSVRNKEGLNLGAIHLTLDKGTRKITWITIQIDSHGTDSLERVKEFLILAYKLARDHEPQPITLSTDPDSSDDILI